MQLCLVSLHFCMVAALRQSLTSTYSRSFTRCMYHSYNNARKHAFKHTIAMSLELLITVKHILTKNCRQNHPAGNMTEYTTYSLQYSLQFNVRSCYCFVKESTKWVEKSCSENVVEV